MVLGGREAKPTSARPVPLRTILGSSTSVPTSRRRALTWWGTVAWAAAVLGCATSAFAIRDTMFPQLGRTEPPSAWQAPTRPPASIPYSDREGPVAAGTTVAPAPVAAAGGTPLVLAAVVTDSTVAPNDDDLLSAAAPTVQPAKSDPAPTNTNPTNTTPTNTNPTVTPHSSVSVPTGTVGAGETATTTTTDNTSTTTGASDTLPDDGGGNQRGRSPGGSTGTSVP